MSPASDPVVLVVVDDRAIRQALDHALAAEAGVTVIVDNDGSALGLALVRQQAELQAGGARLEPSPLGGLRAVVAIGAAPPARFA